jgi:Egh16-like virulence factor
MYAPIVLSALSMITLVAAHGKVSVVTGNLGGNGTALGIRGAVVPGAGPNYLTEVDTTIFWSKDIRTDDDLGFTDEAGDNQLSDLSNAMAQSGNTLPQVSSGGSVNGTYHIVTTDGAGPLEALVDESASGKWSTAKSATVTTQPPGDDGNIAAPNTSNNKRSRVYGKLSKRAENVNEDYVSRHFHYFHIHFLGFYILKLTSFSYSPLLLRFHLEHPAPVPSTVSATSAWSKSPTTMTTAHSGLSLLCRWPVLQLRVLRAPLVLWHSRVLQYRPVLR